MNLEVNYRSRLQQGLAKIRQKWVPLWRNRDTRASVRVDR